MQYDARLQARPSADVMRTVPAAAGQQALDVGSIRDSYYYVPVHYDAGHPAPLALLLHGAGGHADHGLGLLRHLADEHGMILVAPASAAHTWDVIARQAFGPDVALLDRALSHVFARYAVDPTRLAIGGFSDGASYALSVGLANGELFTHVIAFSPGFIAPLAPQGLPKVFISHGAKDDVLPIDPCSRRIVPRLKQSGYAVAYHEFDGGHTVPDEIAQAAIDWFLGGT